MRATAALTIAGLLFTFAACGDDEGSANTASVCDQKDAVQTAVTELAEMNVLAAGTNAFSQAVTNVRTELDELEGSVSEDVKDEVDTLSNAVADAEDTVSSLDEQGTLNEKIDEVQRVLTAVATSAVALGQALDQDCG